MQDHHAKPLDGYVAVVTGASAGIGRATARRLAGGGATVVAVARRNDRLVEVVDEITRNGGRAHAVPADVSVEADRHRIVEQTLARYHRIDALVNNAGVGHVGPIEYVPLDRLRAVFETNLFGVIGLIQQVVPIMRRQGRGRIVNVSSVAGRIARAFSAIYDASKHALEGLSDGLRQELAPFNIQVIVIEPGFIRTEFQEVASRNYGTTKDDEVYAPALASRHATQARLRRLAGQPDDVAELIARVIAVTHPHPRYAVPAFARVALLLERLLPDRFADRAFR